jgi:ribosomal protein L29
MTLPNYKQLKEILSVSKIEEELSFFRKILFDLRMKKSTNKQIKSHLFTHTKRRIAQLNFKKSNLLEFNK